MAHPDPALAPNTAAAEVRPIGLTQPLRWLALGARDLARAPGPGLSHGLTLALFGVAMFIVAHEHFWLLAGAFSGFMLVAPVLATGLYAVSRALERGEPATLASMIAVAVRAWWPRGPTAWRLMRFGALLALAGTGWVLTSASLVTWFVPEVVNSNSGETDEIVCLIPFLKRFNVHLISMTGNPASTLAMTADVNLDISVREEACPLGIVPTASTTATLAMGMRLQFRS